MPDDPSLWVLIVIIVLALGFGVVNGFNDAANAIATVIGTRVLSPRNAIIMAAFFNLAGAATGTAVARTIGKGILVPDAISFQTVVAALSAVIIWTTLATYRGLPVSLTHGFVAAMAAAGIAAALDFIVGSVFLAHRRTPQNGKRSGKRFRIGCSVGTGFLVKPLKKRSLFHVRQDLDDPADMNALCLVADGALRIRHAGRQSIIMILVVMQG